MATFFQVEGSGVVRTSWWTQHLETLSPDVWCPAMKIKIDFTESRHLWLLGRNQAAEENQHRRLEQIHGANSSQCHISLPVVPWRQSNKHFQPISFIYFGEKNRKWGGNQDLCLLPQCLCPQTVKWRARPRPQSPDKTVKSSFWKQTSFPWRRNLQPASSDTTNLYITACRSH